MTTLEEALSSITNTTTTCEVEPDCRLNYDHDPYSPAKYPTFKTKRKPKKKIDEEPKKKARKTLKLELSKRGKIQSTLDRWLHRPKATSKVRFKEHVLLKEIMSNSESWTIIPLKGFSTPSGSFYQKRQEMKRDMKNRHYWRRQRLTPNTVRKTTHILERLLRENH